MTDRSSGPDSTQHHDTEQPHAQQVDEEEFREACKTLDGILEVDVEAVLAHLVENGQQLTTDLALNGLTDIWMICCDDLPEPFTIDHVLTLAEGKRGVLTDRSRLRTKYCTYFHLDPINDAALTLFRARPASTPQFGLSDFQYEGEEWSVHIEQGLTAFAGAIAATGGIHEFNPPMNWWDLFVTVDHDKRASDSKIDAVCDLFLYGLSVNHGLDLRVANYPEYHDIEEEEHTLQSASSADGAESEPERTVALPAGRGAAELARLWLDAATAPHPHSALVFFTKVMEYVATTVFRLHTHDQLRRLLRSPESRAPSAEYLDDLLQVASKADRIRSSDKDMLAQAIQHCCSASRIAAVLPERLKGTAQLMKSLTTPDARKGLAAFADVVSSTRNQLVHAKVNYAPTGSEYPIENISELIPAVRLCAAQIASWFFEQPDSVRVTSRQLE
jgi:hypothetical protein